MARQVTVRVQEPSGAWGTVASMRAANIALRLRRRTLGDVTREALEIADRWRRGYFGDRGQTVAVNIKRVR